MSRPARGGWIEIVNQRKQKINSQSRPARGGWIEMCAGHGGSGRANVPPRTGRVD